MITQSKPKLGIQHNAIGQLSLLLILLVMALAASQARAHEIRPSIIDLTLSQNGDFELVLNVNLEALIAGIGGNHNDTENAPQAAHYNYLRALESAQLSVVFQAFLTELHRDIHFSTSDQRLEFTFKRAEIPPVGDLDLARDSVITFNGTLPADTKTLNWTWPERWGANALRVLSSDGKDFFSAYLQNGRSAEGIDVSSVVSQRRGVFSITVIIGLIASSVLMMVCLGIWFRRRTATLRAP